jgi:hypothetical protein
MRLEIAVYLDLRRDASEPMRAAYEAVLESLPFEGETEFQTAQSSTSAAA